VTELSGYALSLLREGQSRLYRGLGDGLAPIFLVAPCGDYPSPGSRQRFEHEYALRAALAICRPIIQAHGGQLWARHQRPRGAVFQLRLPTDSQEVP
jgi:hypothetical protein